MGDLKNRLRQEKPWAKLGWSKKQWKREKLWKSAGVSEEKFADFLRALDDEHIQNLKDSAQAEALLESMGIKEFGSEDDTGMDQASKNMG